MSASRRSIAVRAGFVLAALALCAAVVSVKAGAIFGSFAANTRARAGMLAQTEAYRSARYFPRLAERGEDYAVVKDAAGTVVWRSPSLGAGTLPDGAADEMTSATLPDGKPGWVTTVYTANGKATYGSSNFDRWGGMLRYVGPPFAAFVVPVAVLAWLYPGRARGVRA